MASLPYSYLKNPIMKKDLFSPEGVVFEVDDLNVDSHSEDDDDDKDYFANEENISDLYLGMSDKDMVRNKSDWTDMTFDEIAQGMKAVCTDAVLKRVVKEGFGEVMPPKSLVVCHYSSFLEKQPEPFDSSRLRNIPLKFVLGDSGKVVLGFDLAVGSMRQGEISEFIVDSTYAFGPMGCPPRVPPDATIFYIIEVTTCMPSELGDENIEGMAPEEQTRFNYNKVTTAAKNEHLQGNENFKQGNYNIAKVCYKKALKMLQNLNLADENQDRECAKIMNKLHLNLAQCFLYLKEPGLASFHCKRVIEVDSKNVKALFRCGKANRILGEFEQAHKYLRRALQIESHDQLIMAEIELNLRDKKLYHERQKHFCKKMFGNDDSATDLKKDPQVSEHFRETVLATLKDFVNNDDLEEYPCNCGFTDDEIAYIAKLGQEMGLKCVYPIKCDAKLKLIKEQAKL